MLWETDLNGAKRGGGEGGAGPYFECGMCLSLCERLLQSCSYSWVPSGSLGLRCCVRDFPLRVVLAWRISVYAVSLESRLP